MSCCRGPPKRSRCRRAGEAEGEVTRWKHRSRKASSVRRSRASTRSGSFVIDSGSSRTGATVQRAGRRCNRRGPGTPRRVVTGGCSMCAVGECAGQFGRWSGWWVSPRVGAVTVLGPATRRWLPTAQPTRSRLPSAPSSQGSRVAGTSLVMSGECRPCRRPRGGGPSSRLVVGMTFGRPVATRRPRRDGSSSRLARTRLPDGRENDNPIWPPVMV
jgi:hypothetical protein